jgi:hypothetical protein
MGISRLHFSMVTCLTLLAAGCSPKLPAGSGATADRADLARLAGFMAGSFSSAEQAASDTSYFDIRLRMAPIWSERKDGFWFYVEQAVESHEDKPYRQRVYHLMQLSPTVFESDVYTLRAPLRFAGEWKKERPLANLTPDSLMARDGCSILMRRKSEDLYSGSTIGRDCPSDLRGASFATSEVELRPAQLTSWDRGFDDGGRQVWGAVRGPYVFKKIEDWSSRSGRH